MSTGLIIAIVVVATTFVTEARSNIVPVETSGAVSS